MNAPNDDSTALRTGWRRVFPRWEFRHLRIWATARIGGGVVATVCAILTLSFGGSDAATYGWAAFFLAIAAIAFAVGYWQLTIARSTSARA
jgi:hypothetical protein